MGSEATRKQTILIVHNFYQIPGGEDTVVANEKKMLENHGHRVILYTRSNTELRKMSLLQKCCLPVTTIFNPRTYKEIRQIIKSERIDIVHVHNTLNLISPAVYYAAKSMHLPVVQTVHNFRLLCPGGTFYRDGQICEDCVEYGLKCAVKHGCYRGSKIQTLACVISTWFHRMTGIYGKINYICLTEFNRDKLLQLKRIKPECVFVKPNFVESKEGVVPEEKRQNQFVFAGRLDKLKGIDLLFEAWKLMGEKAPKLIVCGTGPMEEWCRESIRNNKLNIEMLGFVPNKETLKIISESKALVLPTQLYEGFPMSIVEAFSVGTPVLCSDLGNAGSVVVEGLTGYKFDPKMVDRIIDAVKMIEQKALSNSEIKMIFEKNYSSEANYRIMMKVYDNLK